MNRFRFRLQGLLDRARKRETATQASLAAVLRVQAERRAALGALDAAPFEVLRLLDDARAACRRRLATSHDEIAHLRCAVMAAARERRALETLRERRRAEFELARARAEDRELDELNAQRTRRA